MAGKFAVASALLALFITSIPLGAVQQKETSKPERIAISKLKDKLDSGEKFILIDVREDWELEQDGAIAGAIHIPVAELDKRMKDIPKDVELVFY